MSILGKVKRFFSLEGYTTLEVELLTGHKHCTNCGAFYYPTTSVTSINHTLCADCAHNPLVRMKIVS